MMSKRTIASAVLAACLGMSGLAGAATYTNTDTFSFTLDGLSDVSIDYLASDLAYFRNNKPSESLYSTVGSLAWSIAGLGSGTFTGAAASSGSLDFFDVAAGTYTATLTGTWSYTGNFPTSSTYVSGGLVSHGLTVTPVPEPGEWALMLSGLGLIGYVARRRRQGAAA